MGPLVSVGTRSGGAVALARWVRRRNTKAVIRSQSGSFAPAGYRFPREVIAVAVRWYLRYGLSYRDVEELLAERGVEVDHVTIYRWVQMFTAEFIDAARPARHAGGERWFVDETSSDNRVWILDLQQTVGRLRRRWLAAPGAQCSTV
jgi:hypothetical protein